MVSKSGRSCRGNSKPRFVRFEDSHGDGLFSVAEYILTGADMGHIRVNRKTMRELRTLYAQLCQLTPPTTPRAYDDTRNRRPITWYYETSKNALQIADRLMHALNSLGADVRRVERTRLPLVLWQDDVQVVTRRPRRPTPTNTMSIVEQRRARRRKRQRQRRMRAGRARVRAAKSAF